MDPRWTMLDPLVVESILAIIDHDFPRGFQLVGPKVHLLGDTGLANQISIYESQAF